MGCRALPHGANLLSDRRTLARAAAIAAGSVDAPHAVAHEGGGSGPLCGVDDAPPFAGLQETAKPSQQLNLSSGWPRAVEGVPNHGHGRCPLAGAHVSVGLHDGQCRLPTMLHASLTAPWHSPYPNGKVPCHGNVAGAAGRLGPAHARRCKARPTAHLWQAAPCGPAFSPALASSRSQPAKMVGMTEMERQRAERMKANAEKLKVRHRRQPRC